MRWKRLEKARDAVGLKNETRSFLRRVVRFFGRVRCRRSDFSIVLCTIFKLMMAKSSEEG